MTAFEFGFSDKKERNARLEQIEARLTALETRRSGFAVGGFTKKPESTSMRLHELVSDAMEACQKANIPDGYDTKKGLRFALAALRQIEGMSRTNFARDVVTNRAKQALDELHSEFEQCREEERIRKIAREEVIKMSPSTPRNA